MNYKLLIFFTNNSNSGMAATSTVIDFFDKADAEAAQLALKGKVVSYLLTEKVFSIESLFIDLLKANPLDSPESVLKRATVAYNLIYPKTKETTLESWSQKIESNK